MLLERIPMAAFPVKTRPVKGAVFGFGSIGPVHLTSVQGTQDDKLGPIPGVEIVGVAEPMAERAANIPAGVPVFPDFQTVLSTIPVDVVHICLPHNLHAPATIAAAERGVNVICEKPMALDAREARRMADAVNANGVGFSLISQNRLNPEKAWMKAKVSAGETGALRSIDWVVDWYRSAEYYAAGSGWRGRDSDARGGVLSNQAYHTLDLVLWLVDSPVREVVAECSTDESVHGPIDVPDRVEGHLVFENGVQSRFLCTVCGDKNDVIRVDMRGAKGGAGTVVVADGTSIIEQNLAPETPHFVADGTLLGKSCYGSSHQTNIALSYEAFMNGSTPPVGAATGIRVLTVIDAILASNGKPVRVQ